MPASTGWAKLNAPLPPTVTVSPLAVLRSATTPMLPLTVPDSRKAVAAQATLMEGAGPLESATPSPPETVQVWFSGWLRTVMR